MRYGIYKILESGQMPFILNVFYIIFYFFFTLPYSFSLLFSSISSLPKIQKKPPYSHFQKNTLAVNI